MSESDASAMSAHDRDWAERRETERRHAERRHGDPGDMAADRPEDAPIRLKTLQQWLPSLVLLVTVIGWMFMLRGDADRTRQDVERLQAAETQRAMRELDAATNIATKADVQLLRTEIQALRAEMTATRLQAGGR